MGIHDDYGKRVMRLASNNVFTDWGSSVEIDYGSGKPARIDGTIEDVIAVEIESRTAKQVRGAVVDLIFHRFPKKLLVIIPVHMSDPFTTRAQCHFILERFLEPSDFRVALLKGSGDFPSADSDVQIIKKALQDLGFKGKD